MTIIRGAQILQSRITIYMEGASIVWENEARCLIYLRGGKGDKNLGLVIGQLVITKIINIIATRCHILRLKTRNSIPDGRPLYIGHTVSETNKQY